MTQRKLDLPPPAVETSAERPETPAEPALPAPPAPAESPEPVGRPVSGEPAPSREPSDRALRERQLAWLRERARFRAPDPDSAAPPQDK